MEITKETIKAAVVEALKEEIKPFYIERETHYQDHLFIKELREWLDSIKSTAWKTIAKIVITGIIGLLILGFIFWGKTTK